jgi:hypothetical protein
VSHSQWYARRIIAPGDIEHAGAHGRKRNGRIMAAGDAPDCAVAAAMRSSPSRTTIVNLLRTVEIVTRLLRR